MSRLSDRDRAELDYLNVRNDIEELVDRVGYENILKHMIEKLDHIDDINNRSKDLAQSKRIELDKTVVDIGNYEEDIKKVRTEIASLQKEILDETNKRFPTAEERWPRAGEVIDGR